jgi:hypothetical protein
MKSINYLFAIACCLVCFFTSSCIRLSTDNPPNIPEENTSQSGTEVLIYGGEGTWRAEINSLKKILFLNGATYLEVNAPQLNALSLESLLKYKLLVIPGGDSLRVTKALLVETLVRLRSAVKFGGLNYLGFCSGAWLAVAPHPLPGQGLTYGLGLIEESVLKETILHNQGLKYSIVKASFADGEVRDQLWYGGPITPEIPGKVFARYPDGTAAISQISSGQGLVILSGLHPTADKNILAALGLIDRAAITPEIAWKVLSSGISHQALPSF